MPTDTLTFYRSGFFKKQWRWKYQSSGNHEQLANGGESYAELGECVRSAFRVCGIENPLSMDENLFRKLPEDVDRLVARGNGFDVEVRVR